MSGTDYIPVTNHLGKHEVHRNALRVFGEKRGLAWDLDTLAGKAAGEWRLVTGRDNSKLLDAVVPPEKPAQRIEPARIPRRDGPR